MITSFYKQRLIFSIYFTNCKNFCHYIHIRKIKKVRTYNMSILILFNTTGGTTRIRNFCYSKMFVYCIFERNVYSYYLIMKYCILLTATFNRIQSHSASQHLEYRILPITYLKNLAILLNVKMGIFVMIILLPYL